MAKDKIHYLVKEALEKSDWRITHDPYYLKALQVEQEIDLGAEEIVAAELEGKKIAIEIKSFLRGSFINEFHSALGQYLNYEIGLEEQEPDRTLYLAVSSIIYDTYFQKTAIQRAIEKHHLKLIIIDIQTKEIVKWIV